MEQFNTPFGDRCGIMGYIWLEKKQDDEWKDFCDYNDIGLPLAFAVAEGIVDINKEVEKYINETWLLLLAGLDIEDTGFTSLEHMLTGIEED